ncbi:MAG TPA: cation-translocating P-type ATPase [Polyangiaceae bacterium]
MAPQGLTSRQVQERRSIDGFNELPSADRRGLVASVMAIVSEPMSLLLLVCGGIYVVIGDAHEAAMLLGFVVFIMVLTLAQERKTERALEALRDLASPRALVIRDGRRVRIAGRDLVLDDVVVLAEGDRVPADVVILSGSHLAADESLLTGESAPVRKTVWDGATELQRPGGEDQPFLYAGTLLTGGAGIGRVLATGPRTEIGRIGGTMRSHAPQQTPLQKEARRLVARLAWMAAALSAAAAVGYGLVTRDVLEGVLAGLTLAMAILPNEFPVVVTMFLALGAWRLSRRRVLARRVPAVESLGAVTVLCVDKTGTLTVNHMTVSRIHAGGESLDVRRAESSDLPESMHETIEYAILASRRDPFDPMERAFKELGERKLAGTEHLHDDWQLLREIPLSRQRLAMVRLWRAPDRANLVVAAKGAPEAIQQLCGCDAGETERIKQGVASLAEDGLRVLAVARAELEPFRLADEPETWSLRFVGLVGLEDPVRSGVPEAVAQCRTAGIRVVMITGDYPVTAQAVARSAGIESGSVLTGRDLAAMDDAALEERVQDTSVFARMLPEQKLRLVRALQAGGEIVGMTGDGVNDAPALDAAHIGIAMGARGTDVAREAAGVVLLDDDFGSLVAGVRLGRRIVDNLRKALAYVVAVHLPIVGLTLAPIAFDWPLVLLPIHVAFLHLVIDPACSVVFEGQPEEPNVMQRPPRDPKAPLFGRGVLGVSLVQGLSVLAVVVVVYALALRSGRPDAVARTLTFTTFLLANLALIFTNRSWSRVIAASPLRDVTLWAVVGGALSFLALVIYVPALAALFRFAPLRPLDVAVCVAASALAITWFEVAKLARWRRKSFRDANEVRSADHVRARTQAHVRH